MNNFKSQSELFFCKPPNTIIDNGNFHISYNPQPIGYGTETTAIVLDNNVYLILNGDHTKELNDVTQIDQAIDYFVNNIKVANKYSEHRMIIGLQEDMFGLTKTALNVIGQDNINKILNNC